MNAAPCCILWKQHSRSKTNHLCRENNAARVSEFQTRMQVKTEVSDRAISIQKIKETDNQVSNSIFLVQFPVLKDDTSTKIVTFKEAATNPFNRCIVNSTIGKHITSVLCNTCYMLAAFGASLVMPSYFFILIFVGDIFVDLGLQKDDLSLGLVLLNIFNVVGRLLAGIVLQSKFVSILFLLSFSSVASFFFFLLLTFAKGYKIVIAVTALFGVPIGMFFTLLNTMTLELIEPNILPVAFGIGFTLNGIANLVSGPVNGKKTFSSIP